MSEYDKYDEYLCDVLGFDGHTDCDETVDTTGWADLLADDDCSDSNEE